MVAERECFKILPALAIMEVLMKTEVKKILKKVTADKHLLTAVLIVFLLALITTSVIGFSLQARELKMPFRYSGFGTTTIYFNRWFYLLNFMILNFLVFIFHTALAIKISMVGNRKMALVYVWLGAGLVVFNFIVSLSIINVQKVL